jgi:hypothetical protein
LLEDLFADSLGEAAGDDDFSDEAAGLLFKDVLDDFEGFGFCGFDEAAGVDNDKVGLVGVFDEGEAGLDDLGEHLFAVNNVLGAAQCVEADG